jgi:hypothetical protein
MMRRRYLGLALAATLAVFASPGRARATSATETAAVIESQSAPLPEPAMLLVLGCVLAGIGTKLRRRQT